MERARKLMGRRQEMMRKLLFLAAIVALLSSSFSYGGGPEKRTAMPAPEKVGSLPGELVRIGDFSVAISNIQREEREAILNFALTKVTDTNAGPQILQVTLIDDHKNEYKGTLRIDFGAADILNAIPKSFTYVEILTISMPERAPIEKLRLGEKERDFARIKFGEPRFLENFGNSAVGKGEKVRVGEWFSFTMSQIKPEPRRWELPIEVENKEYNPLRAEVKVGVQYKDGTISWTSPYSINVPATSKSVAKLSLPIPCWVKGGPPKPGILLLAYTGEKAKNIELRMYAMTPNDLPPLVGQGPRQQEDIFVAAYERNGGRQMMGDPLSLPRWFAGGSQPKDRHDLLIQEFPSAPKFGKSVIIWDKQAGALNAYVINSPVLDKYVSLGAPYSMLLAPIGDTIAIKARESHFKTDGLYSEFQGGAIGSMPNQAPVAVTGKVFAKWKEKGLTKGLLGFPLADMRRVPPSGAQGFNTTGLTQQFEGGQVFLPTSGPRNGLAVAVLGERLLKAYEQTGGTSGWLGFPVGELSEGRDINELLLAFHDPLEFIEFEGGLLVRWDRKNPAENWRAYCNRYLEGKYIIEGQTKKEMNYGGSSRVGWTGWFSRAEDFGVKGIFLLDSALAMDDTITINVSVTFEKVKGFFPNETTALIRGVLVEHYGWKDVTHHQPITVAGLFAATPLVALKMNVPYSGSITFPLPKKCGLLRFYVPWPNGYLVGPMTFALSSQESEKLMMAQDYLKKPYENDTTVYSKILAELPYEYEGDIKQVKRDRLKFEEFVNKYPTSKYAPEALYNIVFLYYYPVQCEIDEDFAKECVIGVKKTYSILLQQFPSSEWTHKAKAYFEMAQEYASKRFEEKETEKVPRHVPMDELKEKQRNAMKDITDISTAIADYIADNKVAPEQAGIYDINNRFYASLSPFYIKVLPIKDPWGNNYRVYCGKACNGKYGLTNPGVDDFVVCSYGLDGKEEAWEFDPHNPEAGLFIAKELSDLNKDLVMWNGSWVRGPRTAETVR